MGLGMWSAVVGVFLFSWGPVFVRDNEFGALPFAFWRLVGAAAWAVAALYLRGGRLDRRVLRHSLAGGLVFTVNAATFFTAIKTTAVANAMVVGATAPIFLLWAASRVFQERISFRVVLATPIAVAGMILMLVGRSGGSGDASLTGDVLAVVAMFAFAGYLVASRIARNHLSALEYQAGWSTIAAGLMLPISLLSFDPLVIADGWSWGVAATMAVTAGLAHLLFNYSHRYVPMRALSLLNMAAPGLAVVWAWFLFDEQLGGLQWLGIPLVVISVLAVVLDE
ncbi:MAG: EamA family transporter [Acidimicrobiia bacterium]|nr:EamA family transporter [bacterium]MXW59240.1 EamA family transporter [Acidimicrobiia bacterium]MXZ76749.1 EamA family transporter [Acidimicrobiia bacterium]MXZ85285.1 EamA family transporter [Acidimicrobiia bacterium]MYB08491.1 EamA family transporter [Acidimicrobiia bacterium]